MLIMMLVYKLNNASDNELPWRMPLPTKSGRDRQLFQRTAANNFEYRLHMTSTTGVSWSLTSLFSTNVAISETSQQQEVECLHQTVYRTSWNDLHYRVLSLHVMFSTGRNRDAALAREVEENVAGPLRRAGARAQPGRTVRGRGEETAISDRGTEERDFQRRRRGTCVCVLLLSRPVFEWTCVTLHSLIGAFGLYLPQTLLLL